MRNGGERTLDQIGIAEFLQRQARKVHGRGQFGMGRQRVSQVVQTGGTVAILPDDRGRLVKMKDLVVLLVIDDEFVVHPLDDSSVLTLSNHCVLPLRCDMLPSTFLVPGS